MRPVEARGQAATVAATDIVKAAGRRDGPGRPGANGLGPRPSSSAGTLPAVPAPPPAQAPPRAQEAAGRVRQHATLRLGWLAEPDNLNPFVGTTMAAYTVWYMNYDTLVGLNAADLTPDRTTGLASDWTHQGGKVWTSRIRRNVTWQDGRPLTARDVAFTINYRQQPERRPGSATSRT